MKKQIKYFVVLLLLLITSASGMITVEKSAVTVKRTPTATITNTAIGKITLTSTLTQTVTPTLTMTHTQTVFTSTPSITVMASLTPTASATSSGNVEPYLSAPLCGFHSNSVFHTLWDSELGCHYDHEHGQYPFNLSFPVDMQAFMGGVEIGHTNPSSPAENTVKHGGMKWQVDSSAPNNCAVGFESGTVAVDAYAIQYHIFGRQDVEHEAHLHSSVAFLQQCKADNPEDKGIVAVTQIQEYGQRIMPYQGMNLIYPDSFSPTWDTRRGQYFTTECFGSDFFANVNGASQLIDCRPTFSDTSNNLTIWTSKISGSGLRPAGSTLFTLLFRSRDNYQRLDATDLVHPFTWRFVCGGTVYNPANCRFNNSSVTIHEIAGTIPASWDNLAGWDTDPRVGRVSAVGFVDKFGTRSTTCTAVGGDCYPITLINAFVGRYSTDLCISKCNNPNLTDTRERDFYFCNDVLCAEGMPNAVPSSWIGSEN